MVHVVASGNHGELQRIIAVQARLNGTVALLIGLAATLVTLLPVLWEISQHVNTMAHEGGHALMGALVGHRVMSVRMEANGDGVTLTRGRAGLGSVVTGFVGYPAPGLLGLGAAKLIAMGHIVAVLWLLALALAVLLLVARGWFAVTCVLCAGFLLYLTLRYASLGTQVTVAYGTTWFLLISGFAVVVSHGVNAGDAANLKSRTRLPAGLWAGLWFLGSVCTLVLGAKLLL
jgi:hypothetical protein